ncbi:MAG: guanylate kinase [Rikenellaceae bacterium]
MPSKDNKVIIFSAPSGSGKTTIVQYLLKQFETLQFSVSATSRAPRGKEVNGKDYFFISTEEFEKRISDGAFVESEEVYKGVYYGTLLSEVERLWADGKTIVFDVDVKGGIRLKEKFGAQALSLFIMPPSISELESRLKNRGTDSQENIAKRVAKAEIEIADAENFDTIIVNDNLEVALKEAHKIVADFLA